MSTLPGLCDSAAPFKSKLRAPFPLSQFCISWRKTLNLASLLRSLPPDVCSSHSGRACTEIIGWNFVYNYGADDQYTATLHDCATGYMLPACQTTVCLANGTWKTPIPRCEGESLRQCIAGERAERPCWYHLIFNWVSSGDTGGNDFDLIITKRRFDAQHHHQSKDFWMHEDFLLMMMLCLKTSFQPVL